MREFKLTDGDFRALATLLREKTGIVLKNHKSDMVYSRLARRLRSLDIPDFKTYLAYIKDPANSGEITEMMNALTTNLTRFFREAHQIEDFCQTLRHSPARREPVLVWSAGCSTGQEPYSIALACKASFPDPLFKSVRILATDIDTAVLRKASAARYPREKMPEIPTTMHRHLDVGDRDFTLKRELRDLVHFRVLNLLGTWPHRQRYDAIFCRNVLIYFDKPTQHALVTRFAQRLKPGGRLYLGHSESMAANDTPLISKGKSIFVPHQRDQSEVRVA